MPTELFRNTAEGYSASGTGVTAGSGGNSGGGSGDYWTVVNLGSSTIQALTGAAMFGAYGYRLTRSGSTQQHLQVTLAADQSDFVGQHWMRIPTQPSVDHVLFKGYSDTAATVTAWAVAISTAGKLKILEGPSSTPVGAAGTDTIPANTWLRCEYEIISATSARVVIYAGASNTVLADSGVRAAPSAGVTRTFRIGLLTTASSPASMDIDHVRLGAGPGLFALATTWRPTETVSNPGAFTAVGTGTLHGALGDVETEAAPATYIESPAGPSGAQCTVGSSITILPTGGLTVECWHSQDLASPTIRTLHEVLLDGAVIGSDTVDCTTTPTKRTWTISSASGDMTTLRSRFTDTTL